MNGEPEPTSLAVARPDLSAALVKRLLELIRRENLRPGDRLPSAKALAETFAVATPTIREALRRLQATGVVDIRHGAGIYVRDGHERLMFANPNRDVLDARTLLHLLDTRLLIEPHLAELAAEHASVTDVAELKRLLDETEHQLIGDDAALRRANMAFHARIGRASGNPVLAQVIETLIELYSSEQPAILALSNGRAHDHQDHLAILAAIQARDAARARERMCRHILHVRSVVGTRLAASRGEADTYRAQPGKGESPPVARSVDGLTGEEP